jgi:hypothetical protein
MPPTDAPPPPPLRFCSSCKINKPETREHFALKNGVLDRTCIKCKTRKSKKKTAKRVDSDTDPSDKENKGDDDDGAADEEDLDSLHITTIEDFLAAISMDEDCRTFGAFIDAAVLEKSGRELADAIAKEIFEAIGYRFM